MACTALGRALGNLARGGLGYDVSPYMIDINDLARQVVEAGHQLTIPGAEEVSRALRLPYTPR